MKMSNIKTFFLFKRKEDEEEKKNDSIIIIIKKTKSTYTTIHLSDRQTYESV